MSQIQDLIALYQSKISRDKHQYLGWTCIYTPEEIITAAGLVPYRVNGATAPTPLADQHLQVNICGYARSCFELALKGDYAFLQGIVMSHTCDTFCKLFDVWRYNVSMPFYYQLNTPHVTNARAQRFFKAELSKFILSLENKFGCTIDEDSLNYAIQAHNTNRQLLHELYKLRRSDPPRIKGSDMLSLVLATMAMPKEESNQLLREALDWALKHEPQVHDTVRLLVTGGPLDDVSLFKLVEELGADVVYDDTCTGGRYFWDLVEPSAAPLEAIAKRYLEKVPCPCVYPGDRMEHISNQIKDYRVQGVIIYSLKFCDTHLHQVPEIQKDLIEDGIPAMFIESDHLSGFDGQLKTRIQAFIEAIKNRG